MTPINFDQLLKDMTSAAAGALKTKWPDAKDYAEVEFKKIADSVAFITAQMAVGKMSEEQARLHFRLQSNASQQVLMMVEALTILAAEAAINAALVVVKEAVNTAVGVALL